MESLNRFAYFMEKQRKFYFGMLDHKKESTAKKEWKNWDFLRTLSWEGREYASNPRLYGTRNDHATHCMMKSLKT